MSAYNAFDTVSAVVSRISSLLSHLLIFHRHISASQIDDYSSDSCVSNEISLPMPISRPRSAHRLDKNYYRSTDSLGESPEEQPFQPRRRHRGGGGARAFMGAKAASCSDLLLEFDERSSSSRRPVSSLSLFLPLSLPPSLSLSISLSLSLSLSISLSLYLPPSLYLI